ncbi:MAG: HD domain-containing protein [Candidatus Micrarchaeota archaeon]
MASKTQWASEIAKGTKVDSLFLVFQKEMRAFRNKPGNYLQLKLGDKTGTLRAKCWDDAEELNKLIEEGDVLKVRGTADVYQNNVELTLSLKDIQKISSENISAEDFLPRTTKDVEKMFSELLALASSFKNAHLRALLLSFLENKEFAREFKRAPAAKVHHHSYIGGLLEHTYSVVELCKTLCIQYPELDRELLLTGALLHDVGKLREYSFTTRVDYTAEGGLAGHLVLGAHMLNKQFETLPNFPEELKLKLYHLILSHHEKEEWGSPVRPRFSEACALHHADLFDSHVKQFLQIEHEETEKTPANVTWSTFRRELERYLYIKKGEESEE